MARSILAPNQGVPLVKNLGVATVEQDQHRPIGPGWLAAPWPVLFSDPIIIIIHALLVTTYILSSNVKVSYASDMYADMYVRSQGGVHDHISLEAQKLASCLCCPSAHCSEDARSITRVPALPSASRGQDRRTGQTGLEEESFDGLYWPLCALSTRDTGCHVMSKWEDWMDGPPP